jgi:hypothetical protein
MQGKKGMFESSNAPSRNAPSIAANAVVDCTGRPLSAQALVHVGKQARSQTTGHVWEEHSQASLAHTKTGHQPAQPTNGCINA